MSLKKMTKWSQRYRGEYLNIFRACSIWPIYIYKDMLFLFFLLVHIASKDSQIHESFPCENGVQRSESSSDELPNKKRAPHVGDMPQHKFTTRPRAQGISHNSINLNGVITQDYTPQV